MDSNMLKVMLIDDEHLIREKLRRSIDWESLGMVICSEASSAYEALENIDENLPDIIFADICMPFMNGIDFSEIVMEKFPQIKVIILTGHEEFEYARKSVRLGIEDFICKPVNETEIKEVLLVIKEKIERERCYHSQYEEIKQRLEESLPLLKDKFLNELLNSSLSTEDAQKRLAFFGMDFPGNYFQIAAIELFDTDNSITHERKLILALKGMDIICNYLNQFNMLYIFTDNSGRIIILSNNPEVSLEELCEHLKIVIDSFLNCSFGIGISNVQRDIEQIHNCYKEALNALEYMVVEGRNQVISYSDIIKTTSNPIKITPDDLEKLAFYIKAGMAEKALQTADNLFDIRNARAELVKKGIRIVSSTIISTVVSVLASTEIEIREVFEDENPYAFICKDETLPDMRIYIKNVVRKAAKMIENIRISADSRIMERILRYITDNISKSDLSLKGVADTFFLNYSYLSRKFKQEAGNTFREYITGVRMKKAVKIIQETDNKAYQVAEMVGIPDPHYFSICFKKHTGLSISDFRKTKGNFQKVK